MSALPPIADIDQTIADVRFVPISGHPDQEIPVASFDHLVGEPAQVTFTFPI